jgi:hypothetical protein
MACRATHCSSERDALTLNPALAGFFVPEFHAAQSLAGVLPAEVTPGDVHCTLFGLASFASVYVSHRLQGA